MRWATGFTLQHHQILRLPRNKTRMTLPRRRWNVIYSAGSTMWHCSNSPNTALATILVADETSLTMRWATGVILQHHQILCLPRKVTVMIDPCHIWNVRWRTAIAPYCTPFCVRLSYNSTRLLSLCMHSYTRNEVFHIPAIRASKKAALGGSKFMALRAMHFPKLVFPCIPLQFFYHSL